MIYLSLIRSCLKRDGYGKGNGNAVVIAVSIFCLFFIVLGVLSALGIV